MSWRRWRRAQGAEWKTALNRPGASLGSQELTEDSRQRWLRALSDFTGLPPQELKELRILEIGGGIVESAFDDPTTPLKITIDPLFPFPRPVGQVDKTCHRVRAIGEYLPLKDKCIDLCLAANVIDHVISPQAFLSEISRVTARSATVVISCNVFSPALRLFFPVLNIFDSPHPHHYTAANLAEMLGEYFEISSSEVRPIIPPSLKRDRTYALFNDIKTKVAVLSGMKRAHFHCVKRDSLSSVAPPSPSIATGADIESRPERTR